MYSFSANFLDTGLVGVYAGCQPTKVHDVVAISRDVLADVATNGVSDEELERGRGQVVGSLVLSQEDTGSRMSRIGRSELHFGDVPSMSQVLAHIDAVDSAEVKSVAAQIVSGPPTLAVIGPIKGRAAQRLKAAV